jgi:hypothetical protein
MADLKFTQVDDDVVLCENAFTNEELDIIRALCKKTIDETGFVDVATGDNMTRKVETSAFPRTKETSFIYKRMATIIQQINDQYYHLDIEGFAERGLFFVSYKLPGDNIDWHTDKVNHNGTRTDFVKMNAVLQLNDPATEYEGCDIIAMTDGFLNVPKAKGLVFSMPGYVSHKITGLVSGERHAMVAWVTGPRFK